MTLNETELSDVAQKLLAASREMKPIDPLTEIYPKITVEEAYRIQVINVEAQLAEGRKVVGKKIGLTSPAIQQMVGVDEPDYGHLLDDMLVYQGEDLRTSRSLSSADTAQDGPTGVSMTTGSKGNAT